MDTEPTFTIADLAREFNITARAIRFYEDKELIHPKRMGQKRLYSTADRARLSWILRGKRVGFSLSEIGELLDLYLLDDNRETQFQMTLEHCRNRIENLTKQKNDINLTIQELEEFCDTLENEINTKTTSRKTSG